MMNSKQIRGLFGGAIVLPLSLVVLTSSPALAIVFQFCGNFLDGSGGVRRSLIEVDDTTGDFDGFAEITTYAFNNATKTYEERSYDASNFVSRTLAAATTDNPESYKYTFSWNQTGGTLDANNNFEVFIPTSIFPLITNQPQNWPITITNFETREELNSNNQIEVVIRKDPDELRPVVPTPGHFLGLLSALGFGGLKAKKQLDHSEETA